MAHPSESPIFSNRHGRERARWPGWKQPFLGNRLEKTALEEARNLLEFEPTCKRSPFPDRFVLTWFACLSVEYLSTLSAFWNHFSWPDFAASAPVSKQTLRSPACCVSLGRILPHSEPFFSHLKHGNELLWALHTGHWWRLPQGAEWGVGILRRPFVDLPYVSGHVSSVGFHSSWVTAGSHILPCLGGSQYDSPWPAAHPWVTRKPGMDVTSSVNTASHGYGGSSVCLGGKRHHSGWCSVEEMKDGRPWALTWCDDVSVEGPQHLRVGDILRGHPVTLLQESRRGKLCPQLCRERVPRGSRSCCLVCCSEAGL